MDDIILKIVTAVIIPIVGGVLWVNSKVNIHDAFIKDQKQLNTKTDDRLDKILEHVIDIKGAIGYGKPQTGRPVPQV